MSVEVWAKVLTAMEAGVFIDYDCMQDEHVVVGQGKRMPAESGQSDMQIFAAACDALSLPWQQHPVWRMWAALEWLVNVGYGVGKEGPAPSNQEVTDALENGKAALDAAKGGG